MNETNKMATWRHDDLIQFIELFREQEPLWKTKHKDYHNNVKRTACYEILLEKMREIDNTADLNKVKKKINNLRTVFRKEWKKQIDSQVSGSSADEGYTSKLSYFNNLMFLKDQEIPHEGMSSTSSSIPVEEHEDGNENSSSQDEIPDNLPPPPATNPFKRKKSSQVSNSTIDVTLQNINKKKLSIKPDDTCDIFGKTVASKLKSIPKDQRIWAEKIINETLSEAELGNLSRQSVTRINNIFNNASPNRQTQTSPYSQPHISPYSQPHSSPYSLPNTSPQYSQPQTSPYSQPQTSPYSQAQASPYTQTLLSRNIPPSQQQIQTLPEEQIVLLHIPENQSSQLQTQPLLARQIPPREQFSSEKEQNLVKFFENFES